VNRVPESGLPKGVLDEIEAQGLELLGTVPNDETVYEYDCDGKPSSQVPSDSPSKVAVEKLVDELLEI
ncbi:MAG: carbon monoxide dehydrogenase, partial [Coriobacteriales bacterium]|jgi:CO dehydrogenase maturation factor